MAMPTSQNRDTGRTKSGFVGGFALVDYGIALGWEEEFGVGFGDGQFRGIEGLAADLRVINDGGQVEAEFSENRNSLIEVARRSFPIVPGS